MYFIIIYSFIPIKKNYYSSNCNIKYENFFSKKYISKDIIFENSYRESINEIKNFIHINDPDIVINDLAVFRNGFALPISWYKNLNDKFKVKSFINFLSLDKYFINDIVSISLKFKNIDSNFKLIIYKKEKIYLVFSNIILIAFSWQDIPLNILSEIDKISDKLNLKKDSFQVYDIRMLDKKKIIYKKNINKSLIGRLL